jgi:hypothetical protein
MGGGVLKVTLGTMVSLERDKTTIDILDQHDNHTHSYIRKLYHSYLFVCDNIKSNNITI